MLTLLRGSDVVRHGVQTVVREALPPWLPREGSARLTAFSAAREPHIRSRFPLTFVPRTAAHMFRGTFSARNAERKTTEKMFEMSSGPPVSRTRPECFRNSKQQPLCITGTRKESSGPRTDFSRQLHFSMELLRTQSQKRVRATSIA